MEHTITLDHKVDYKDLYLRLAACLAASHIIVIYGEPKSVFEIMLLPEYYIALLGSTLIAFVLFSIVRFITIKLDRTFSWKERTAERIGMQSFFGLIVPSFCAFFLASFYFYIRGGNILQTTYLQYDFQVVIMQLLLINIYYVAFYFYQQWSHVEKTITALSILEHKAHRPKDTFTVSKGAGNILLHIDDIGYCYRKQDTNYLRTVGGEEFFINLSLDEVQQQLPEEKFFRANRQLLIHRQSIKGYGLLSFGKLEAYLYQALDEEVIISQKRAKDFKKWLEN